MRYIISQASILFNKRGLTCCSQQISPLSYTFLDFIILIVYNNKQFYTSHLATPYKMGIC